MKILAPYFDLTDNAVHLFRGTFCGKLRRNGLPLVAVLRSGKKESDMRLGSLRLTWTDAKTRRAEKEAADKLGCQDLGFAVNKEGTVGDTVDKVQQLILRYYGDVRDQARASFRSAEVLAFFGFLLLTGTVGYLILLDWMRHAPPSWFVDNQGGMSVGWVGLIGGAVVEFIAGTQFVLHGRTAKQFGAFHICLERTHRYLLAYKMAEQVKEHKDDTLEKIVCIMANAPMITQQDIDMLASGHLRPNPQGTGNDQSKSMSAAAGA